MAVAPHASLECTAESNLARSLTSSRSRRARENPQMQPHEEFKKLPEAREGEHEREVKSRAVRGGNGERLGGVRVAGGRGIGNIEKREGGLVGEGGRARGMSIEQLEAEAGRTDARTDGLKRNSWLSGSRSRKRGNPMKQQRLLPSEDEVREAATDWPTLGTTLRRVLRMGGSGVDDRGGLGTGAAGAGAEPTGEAAAGAARSHGWSFCEGMEGAEGATCLAVDEEGLVQQGQEEQPKAALHLPAHPQAEQKQQQQEEEERHRQQELQWQQQEEQQQQQRIPLPPASKMPSIGGLWKPGRLGGDPRVMDYECRFCGKGFDSPRALGGHMNLHRKERKLEDVFLQEAEAQARAEIQLRQQQQLQLLLQQQQQQQEQQQQQGFQLHGQEQPLMLQNQQQWLLQQAKQPQGPSTHSNRSPPHHLLLPPLASDPFLSTLCPEVLQSLFLRSCPSETSPADAVTPRAVITASSFAPAHPASVPPSLPPLPAAAPPPITIPRVTVPSVTTFSQHPSSLSPPVTASQLRATPLDMLASVLPAAVTSGVTSDITSGRPVSAPPVAKKGQGQQVKSGGLQKTQQQQQQQPMEMTEEVIREMESLPVRSVAGAAQEAMQRASGDNLAWLRPHRQQLELLRKQQQEQQQEQELLTQLLALAEQQAQPGIGGVLEQQGKAGQQQGGSSQAEACVGSENVPQGGVEWVGGVRRGEGSVQDLTGLDWLPATSHLFDLSLPAVTMPAVTVPDVTIPDVTMPNVTVPGGAQSEPFPAVPYLTSGPLSSPLVTPSLIRPPVLAGSAVSTPAAAAPLTTPQYGSSAAGAATSHGPSGAAVTSHGPPGAAIPSPVVHGRSIPTASIPARLQSFPSLQPPIFLHQPNLAQQQQQQILTSRPVVSQQREASALTRRPLQGEGAGGSEEDELAQLEQLRQLLLLQEQLIRDQPGGEGLELKRQGLEGMKGVECCGDLNQQVETEGGIAGQEKLCCSEE
ncbi:unnamed protein product [Closterium sp. NIES-65]|nr:unnamed protein product [Closterium sp. NIES-65]